MHLVVVVPSRGRPASARRLAGAFRDTADFDRTDLLFAVDDDDPELAAYQELADEDPWAGLTVLPHPRRIGPILNAVAVSLAPFCNYLGFMGDDHLPSTDGWDRALTGELDGTLGVAYGNDLHQGARLPTAMVVSSVLIRKLGYFCPPGLTHLYLDNFWALLGSVTRLAYRDDVIIEHLHVAAGKAPMDAGYEFSLDPGLDMQDRVAYDTFLRGRWEDDRRMIAEMMTGA